MFRIINVHYLKAKYFYKYYDGVIAPGQYYYRGFAVFNRIPFEFFFTEDDIFNKGKISNSILIKEYSIHKIEKNRRGSDNNDRVD